jgi:hypothetical protein
VRENIVYFTQSNYTFTLTEKYEILVKKFGKIAGSYLQPKKCKQKRNIEAFSCNNCCSGNAIRMTCCECMFMALGFQHAMRMRHIITSGLSVRLYNIFAHYLINGTILEKRLLNIKCVFRFPVEKFSEAFLILRRRERDMIVNVYWHSCKAPVILIQF